MAKIDVDALRSYFLDCCGSAMMSGFPAALLDIADIERASDEDLCRMADRMDVDLRSFSIDTPNEVL